MPVMHSAGDLDVLAAALRTVAPHDADIEVEVGCRRISNDDIDVLFPIEAEAIRTARLRRQSEFATGRALLREMLEIDAAIPRGSGGQPRLPTGVCASIAHDAEFAVAAISRSPGVTALGIDIEIDTVLEPAEVAVIVGPEDRVADPLLTFVQKEAVYKAWSVLGGRILEHHEVAVRSRSSDFDATVAVDGSTFTGRHDAVLNRSLALVVATSSGGA